MISTLAFASVSPNRVPVRRIELSPELETSLGLCRLGVSMRQLRDESPIDEIGPSGNGIQQHLYLVHSTTSRIQFPPFNLKGEISLGGVFDLDVGFDCLGICFYEFRRPRNAPFRVYEGNKSNDVPNSGSDRDSNVVQDATLDAKFAAGQNSSARRSSGFVEHFHDFLRDNGTLGGDGVLKVVSKYEVRAVLLVEPPTDGGESRMRLYADTVGGDED